MWYTYAQENVEKFSHPLLRYLAAEARKCETFEEFKHDYINDIKHGVYWHITRSPNFAIDPSRGPTDRSTMSDGRTNTGKLMITSHPEYWDSHYNYDSENEQRHPADDPYSRPYAAMIDMSEVPRDKYQQVNRGFGNEMMVHDIQNARVDRILPVEEALKLDEEYYGFIPNTEDELKQFYILARRGLI